MNHLMSKHHHQLLPHLIRKKKLITKSMIHLVNKILKTQDKDVRPEYCFHFRCFTAGYGGRDLRPEDRPNIEDPQTQHNAISLSQSSYNSSTNDANPHPCTSGVARNLAVRGSATEILLGVGGGSKPRWWC